MSTATADRPEALLPLRRVMDERAALPVLLYFGTAILWLLAGTAFGLGASLKFDMPDWLGSISSPDVRPPPSRAP